MEIESTISLCKLLSGKQKVTNYSLIRASLQILHNYTKENQKNEELKEMIVFALDKIILLLGFNEQLTESEFHSQKMSELYFKIAHGYSQTAPNLYITWLEALAAYNFEVIYFFFYFAFLGGF